MTVIAAGAISGHITRASGGDAHFLWVDAYPVGGGAPVSTLTTAGDYSIDGLVPGQYYVYVRLSLGEEDAAGFYPDGVPRAQAQAVTVTGGRTTSGISSRQRRRASSPAICRCRRARRASQ